MGRFLLRDPHAQREPVTVEDIFVHSINTGAARIAEAAGVERQQRFLESLGLFDKLETEAGTAPKPVFPSVWRPSNAMTIAYGHGIAVPPIIFAQAMATVINGGERIKPTFLLADGMSDTTAEKPLKPETSALMRDLMRLVVQRGTGRRAGVAGPRHRRQDRNRAQGEGGALHPRCRQQLRGGAARVRSALPGAGDARRAEARNAGQIERGRL